MLIVKLNKTLTLMRSSLLLLAGFSWSATTTEGLLLYSLDGAMVFDPYDLDLEVTPHAVRRQLRLREWAAAVVLAFRLNEEALKLEVLEAVPQDQGRSQPLSVVAMGLGFLKVT